MPFTYTRTVRFGDTDAAGVVYFANVLTMCHEAYEESLAESGINLKIFFSNPNAAIPIVHASVDFFRPIFCGDRILINLHPKYLSSNKFEIDYQILAATEQVVAKAITRHVCINAVNRSKQDLPEEIIIWLQQWRDLKETSITET